VTLERQALKVLQVPKALKVRLVQPVKLVLLVLQDLKALVAS
jgi:hypothetical protein